VRDNDRRSLLTIAILASFPHPILILVEKAFIRLLKLANFDIGLAIEGVYLTYFLSKLVGEEEKEYHDY
jgi:hypothetical protein